MLNISSLPTLQNDHDYRTLREPRAAVTTGGMSNCGASTQAQGNSALAECSPHLPLLPLGLQCGLDILESVFQKRHIDYALLPPPALMSSAPRCAYVGIKACDETAVVTTTDEFAVNAFKLKMTPFGFRLAPVFRSTSASLLDIVNIVEINDAKTTEGNNAVPINLFPVPEITIKQLQAMTLATRSGCESMAAALTVATSPTS